MRLLLPIIIVCILIGGYFLANALKQKISRTQTTTSSPSSQELKTFQSKIMKFSINTPIKFDSVENLGRATISSPEGKLYIDRNATNFDNLDDYLKDLNNRNKAEILTEEKKTVSDYQASSRSVRFSTGEVQKEIVIFADGWIYNFFTNEESLYDDLDQIAQSFRYIP